MFSFLKKNNKIEIIAPVKGEIKAIETVSDPVFSEKMMGDGIAIQFNQGDVYAPISGTISTVILPSCHAFGIHSEDGVDILVHIGLDTVNLKGEGFHLLKEKGDVIKQGEKIIEVDHEMLRNKGIDLITPIIVTNSDEFEIVEKASGNAEPKGTTILKIEKK